MKKVMINGQTGYVFNAADYLKTEKSILGFLESVFAEGDISDKLAALKAAETALEKIQRKQARQKSTSVKNIAHSSPL